MALLALGREEEAVAAARLVLQEKYFDMRWWAGEEALFVLRQAGPAGEAGEVLRQSQAVLAPDDVALGPLLHAMGRFDDALPFLEQISPSYYSRFQFQTLWDDVRDDPRFLQLMAKLGCEAEYHVGRETLARMLREREAKA
jgi:hypothetical protein